MSLTKIEIELSSEGDKYKAVLYKQYQDRDPLFIKQGYFSLPDEALREQALHIEAYGGILSDLLFTQAELGDDWSRLVDELPSYLASTRLRLTFVEQGHPQEKELQSLCWEALIDPRGEQRIAKREQLPMSRYIKILNPSSRQPMVHVEPRGTRVKGQVALVVAAASPKLEDYPIPQVDINSLCNQLAASWGAKQIIRIDGFEGRDRATFSSIIKRLQTIERPYILCLACHGILDPDTKEPYFWLESGNKAGEGERIPARVLCNELLSLKRSPLMVVFASCNSMNEESTSNAHSAAGPLLARGGIPAVLAMRGLIRETTVNELLPAFFERLSSSGSPEEALAAARKHTPDEDWRATLWLTVETREFWRTKWPNIDEPLFKKAQEPPRIFVGRAQETEQCKKHLDDTGTVAITGPTGIGKSALAKVICAGFPDTMSDLWVDVSQEVEGPQLLYGLARKILGLDQAEVIALLENSEEQETLYARLARSEKILVLDGLEQARGDNEQAERSNQMEYLLRRLIDCAKSGHFKLIVTSTTIPTILNGTAIRLHPLSTKDVQQWCSLQKLELSEADVQTLHQKTEGWPYYLDLAIPLLLDEQYEQRSDFIRDLATQLSISDDLHKKEFSIYSASAQAMLLMIGVLNGAPITTGGLGDLLGGDVSDAVREIEARHHLTRHPKTDRINVHTLLREYADRRSQQQGAAHFERHEQAAKHYNKRSEHAFWAMFHYDKTDKIKEMLLAASQSLTHDQVILPPARTISLLEKHRRYNKQTLQPDHTLLETLLAEAYLRTGEQQRIQKACSIFGGVVGQSQTSRAEKLNSLDRLCVVRAYDGLADIVLHDEEYRGARSYYEQGRDYLATARLPTRMAKLAERWLARRQGVIVSFWGNRRAELERLESEILTEDPLARARDLLVLATEWAELGENKRAKAHFERTLALRRELGRFDMLATAYVNYSNFFSTQHLFAEAHAQLEEAEKLALEHHLPLVQASVLNTRGIEHYEQSRPDDAEPLLIQALNLYEQVYASLDSYPNDKREAAMRKVPHREAARQNATRGRFDCRYRLADIFILRHDSETAIDYIKQALEKVVNLHPEDQWRRSCALRAHAEAMLLVDNTDTAAADLDQVWHAVLDKKIEDTSDMCRFFSARATLRRKQGILAEAALDAQAGLTFAQRSGSPFLYNLLKRQCEELYSLGA